MQNIIINIVIVLASYCIVVLMQKVIDKLVEGNEMKIKKTRSELVGIYNEYEKRLKIDVAPLNILRGITIQMKLGSEKAKAEFVSECNDIRFKFGSNTFLFFASRIGKMLLHTVAIVSMALTLNGFRIDYLWIPLIILSLVISIVKKHGIVRIIFGLLLFFYFGYFLMYTVVLYIVLIRVSMLLPKKRKGVKE